MALLQMRTKHGARRLRRDLTEAERRLWKRLRNHQLGGWAFRRQHPIPPYIVDLACVEAHVVIEIDGGQHADSESDRKRDADLATAGWRVIRFWNNDAQANTEGVLAQILAALGPHPRPPPASPGEGVDGGPVIFGAAKVAAPAVATAFGTLPRLRRERESTEVP